MPMAFPTKKYSRVRACRFMNRYAQPTTGRTDEPRQRRPECPRPSGLTHSQDEHAQGNRNEGAECAGAGDSGDVSERKAASTETTMAVNSVIAWRSGS